MSSSSARWWEFLPTAIHSWDNPESVRFRKYVTGSHLLLRMFDVETGRTPKELVWEKDGQARLYRYEGERRLRVPVVMVYGVILQGYLLDLMPGTSLIEFLVQEGFDVYLLELGVPGVEERSLPFEKYVVDYFPSGLEQVLSSSGVGEATLFGHCMGGTLSALYLSWDPDAPVRNLVVLAAPIDFRPDDVRALALGSLFARRYPGGDPVGVAQSFAHLGRTIAAMSPPIFGTSERPESGGIRLPEAREPLSRHLQTWLAICKWVDDGIPLMGRSMIEWLENFYQRNEFAQGELELGGRRLSLNDVTCPVMNIAGTQDAITPLLQTQATLGLVGSEDTEELVLPAGHLGLILGAPGKEQMWPNVSGWLQPRSR